MAAAVFVICFLRPFYRTEMLIVEAKNNSQWLHDVTSLVMNPNLFGPVLREEVMLEVSIVHWHAVFTPELA